MRIANAMRAIYVERFICERGENQFTCADGIAGALSIAWSLSIYK